MSPEILKFWCDLGTWKVIGRGLARITASASETRVLRMRTRAISKWKHAKFKNTKIYSKAVHMKISTNEIFPLYGINSSERALQIR